MRNPDERKREGEQVTQKRRERDNTHTRTQHRVDFHFCCCFQTKKEGKDLVLGSKCTQKKERMLFSNDDETYTK